MEDQTIINAVLGSIASVTGWFARELWSAVQTLKDDLYKIREDLAKNYIPKDEFAAFKGELFTLLHRIEDKIEKKEDK